MVVRLLEDIVETFERQVGRYSTRSKRVYKRGEIVEVANSASRVLLPGFRGRRKIMYIRGAQERWHIIEAEVLKGKVIHVPERFTKTRRRLS